MAYVVFCVEKLKWVQCVVRKELVCVCESECCVISGMDSVTHDVAVAPC